MDMPFDLLQRLSQPPSVFEPGEPLFWDDPHISKGLLAAHLSPETEAASRHPDTIDAIVRWLVSTLGLKPGDSVIDLGCGPGLYAERLARAGLRVVGVDYSRRSIGYARESAAKQGLDIEYHYQNYLTLDRDSEFDVALLIYGDFCPLSPDNRDSLLRRVHRALKPGGRFAFDVTTRKHRVRVGEKNNWYVTESGFWKPGPHLVLEEGFDYLDQDIHLDQYIVIEPGGRVTVYRNWFQDYTPATIIPVVEQQGFRVQGYWNDLAGTPYTPDTEWIGLVVERVAAP